MIDKALLRADLEKLAGLGDHLWRDVYRKWFEAHPELRELFEIHSFATKREMLDATLVAVYDLVDDAPWLRENLLAFGARHTTSYEVTDAMYPGWNDAVVEAIRDALGPELDAAHEAAWRAALRAIESVMRGWREHGAHTLSAAI